MSAGEVVDGRCSSISRSSIYSARRIFGGVDACFLLQEFDDVERPVHGVEVVVDPV